MLEFKDNLYLMELCTFSDLDMAIAYWNIVLPGRFKFLDIWCQFLKVSIQLLCNIVLI